MEITDTTPRARAKRAQIRAAAQRLFLQHGFAGTAMDAIAENAGVSKQTLYRYYDNKEGLFADIVYQLTLGRSPVYTPATSDTMVFASRTELEAMLVRIALDLTDKLMEPSFLALLRMVIAEAPRFPKLAALYHAAVIDQGMEFLTMLFRRARECDVIAVARPDLAVRLFIGSVLLPVFSDGLLATAAPPKMPRDEIAALVHLFVAALA